MLNTAHTERDRKSENASKADNKSVNYENGNNQQKSLACISHNSFIYVFLSTCPRLQIITVHDTFVAMT